MKLWEWANAPESRAASIDPAPIAWDDHQIWFGGRLADPKCRIFVAVLNLQPVGQVRLERSLDDDVVRVSVAVDASLRGQGVARWLISQGIEMWIEEFGDAVFQASIRPDNIGSVKAFTAAGFDLARSDRSSEFSLYERGSMA